MNKIFLIILSFLSLISPSIISDTHESFQDDINNAYKNYEYVETIENRYFSIIVVRGMIGDTASYGVSFESVDKNLTCKFDIGEDIYYYTRDKDTTFSFAAARLKSDLTISVVHVGDDGMIYDTIQVSKIDATYSPSVEGNNQGCDFYSLSKLRITDLNLVYSIITIACFVFSVIGIVILYIEQTNRERIRREKINAEIQKMMNIYSAPRANNNHIEAEVISEEVKPVTPFKEAEKVYDNPKRSFDEISDDNNARVKRLLQDKGFITSYKMLGQDEKDLIMVELMMMKSKGVISESEYDYETVELWKE